MTISAPPQVSAWDKLQAEGQKKKSVGTLWAILGRTVAASNKAVLSVRGQKLLCNEVPLLAPKEEEDLKVSGVSIELPAFFFLS